MPAAPRRAFVVSHTHWDREWYLSFAEFRTDLARVVGRVLDALEAGDGYEHFVLDGQSLLLEDHVAARPADAARIRALAAAGRLSLGPWYVLPDVFLVSDEALARNLLIGTRTARGFGGVAATGYMPDSFGHPAQVPQILREAGIDSFVHTRGNGDEIDRTGWVYTWRAPDGSEVLAVNQCDGYCNAGGLGFHEIWHAHTRRRVDPERAVEQVGAVFAHLAERPGGDPALLNNGCDHFPPQQDFARVLARLREAFPDTEFVHADLAAYVAAAREAGHGAAIHEGELLGGRLHNILSGVWSARVPLKQANERCQTLLALELEPLAAYGRFVQGDVHETDLIRHCWKRLLENHPHDSICGCSTDQVHRDMAPRFDECRLTAERLLSGHLLGWTPHFGPEAADDAETLLCVANPLPEARREIVTRRVVVQPTRDDPESFRLFDAAGAEVPFALLDAAYVERFWGVDYRRLSLWEEQLARWSDYRERFAGRILKDGPGSGENGEPLHDLHLTLQFEAELPACGHATFRLRPEPGAAAVPDGDVRCGDGVLENGLVRAELGADGRVDLLDLRSGVRYPGLAAFEDAGDAGDEYDFSPPAAPGPERPRILPGVVRTVRNTGLEGVLAAEFAVRLPARLDPGRDKRSIETVDCPARLELRLRHGSPRLDARLEFENRADDHRLRLRFPTPHDTDALISEGHFQTIRRPLRREPRPDWVQPPPDTWPQQGFSCLEDGAGGLAVLARGLNEVEGFRADGGAGLALTLLRCVEWLSRDDLTTRRGNAGPTLRTPEAQCRGPHVFEFALLPYRGGWLPADVAGESRRWRCPPRSLQGVAAGSRPGGSLVRRTTVRTALTAIKRCEDRDTLIVRLCNLADGPTEERLEFGFDVGAAWRVDLLEERRRALSPQGSALVVSLRPHEIATVEIAPA